jgi:hypothetical protein
MKLLSLYATTIRWERNICIHLLHLLPSDVLTPRRPPTTLAIVILDFLNPLGGHCKNKLPLIVIHDHLLPFIVMVTPHTNMVAIGLTSFCSLTDA